MPTKHKGVVFIFCLFNLCLQDIKGGIVFESMWNESLAAYSSIYPCGMDAWISAIYVSQKV